MCIHMAQVLGCCSDLDTLLQEKEEEQAEKHRQKLRPGRRFVNELQLLVDLLSLKVRQKTS